MMKRPPGLFLSFGSAASKCLRRSPSRSFTMRSWVAASAIGCFGCSPLQTMTASSPPICLAASSTSSCALVPPGARSMTDT